MFLHQKLGYEYKHITDEGSLDDAEFLFKFENNSTLYYDTETTGLHIIKDSPFLIAFGFGNTVYTMHPTVRHLIEFRNLCKKAELVWAHNAKYDYHMMFNAGCDLTDCNLADSMTVARLTSYADDPSSLSLEALGVAYVDDNAKFAGKTIKTISSDINRKRKAEVIKTLGGDKKAKQRFDNYLDKVQYVGEVDTELEALDKPANYEDVYKEKPDLMRNYAADDVVIMMEYLKKSLPILDKVDPGRKIFKQECKSIQVVASMERQGFNIDLNYILESRVKLVAYKEQLYKELQELTGEIFTVGQHAYIKKLFLIKYKVSLETTDIKALKKIQHKDLGDASKVAKLIVTLRNVDKWLSTYIDGKLNSIVEVDGTYRLYSNINNSGTVSGRVSSDMQQQPKYALMSAEGEEIYHPRKAIINDKDYYSFFLDFSQMELRMQAQYTLDISGGDINMCRAYIPFNCISIITGEKYDYKNPEHLESWNSGEWVLEEDQTKFWSKTDLHNVTTHIAFPDIPIDSDEFMKKRKLGKMCNFLKNYQGGINAIIEQLEVSPEIADILDKAYYTAFPKIKDYQYWVNRQLTLNGFVSNLYGRRYYMQESKWYYKCGNYVIQGGCADLVKDKQIKLTEFLKNKKSKLVYPIHDEVYIKIHKDELDIVPKLQAIMQDTLDVMPYIPMISDIEFTKTNWGDKENWKGETV
jgi:DNA polymerase-1